MARIINGALTAVHAGTTEIIIQLKEYPQVQQKMTITIGEAPIEFSAYIEGADTIKLDRLQRYELQGTSNIIGTVNFNIDSNLASIEKIEENKCVVHANNKNKLGEFVLVAEYNDEQYTKTIKVIPLW